MRYNQEIHPHNAKSLASSFIDNGFVIWQIALRTLIIDGEQYSLGSREEVTARHFMELKNQ